MESKWNERDVAAQPELEGLLYASRLVGADQNLVVWGGGNTSAKVVETDFRGRQTRVLRVKGSGSDLRTIQLKDFPGVRLDDVLPLQEREAMSDEVMVAYLAHTLMEPASPRPSIETLLHAFLPARFVIHTHADAILALTNTTRGRELVREALGPGAIWIDYRRPGFALSKQVAEVFAAQPDATSVVLEKHGIITWGDTARAAYEATIAAVTRAEQFVAARRAAALLRPPRSPLTPSPSPTRGEGNEGAVPSALTPPLPAYDSAPPLPWWERGPGGEGLDSPTRRRIYAAIAPLIRGLAGRTTPEGDVLPASEAPEVPPLGRAVLRFDDSPDILAFVSDPAAGRLSQIGPATPDHLVTTRRTPLYVPILPLPLGEAARSAGEVFPLSTGVERGPGGEVPLKQSLEPAWRAWAKDYVRYVQSCAGRVENTAAPSQIDPRPRVVLLPGVGMVTLGRDARAARMAADIYHHAIATIRDAETVDRYVSLDESDCFGVEYWPLELYKLTLAPPEKPLARRVAVVTGAASGIGRSIAQRLAAEGAHVAILDKNAAGAAEAAAQIEQAHGDGRALAVETDVASQESVARAFTEVIATYGGVDIVVSNAGLARSHPVEETSLEEWQLLMDVLTTGYFLVAREAFKCLKAQATGGGVIFIASKNALVAGKDNTAYSAAKAAELHLGRCLAEEGGAHRIRVNTVCPDAVLQGSGIWSAEWREERARTYGIRPDELEDFYRKRTTLKVNVFPGDIAEAVLFFASDRAAKTTGGVLTVDGGVPAAYVR